MPGRTVVGVAADVLGLGLLRRRRLVLVDEHADDLVHRTLEALAGERPPGDLEVWPARDRVLTAPPDLDSYLVAAGGAVGVGETWVAGLDRGAPFAEAG